MILPTLRAVENDLYPGTTAHQTKARIYEQMRELIDELQSQDRQMQFHRRNQASTIRKSW